MPKRDSDPELWNRDWFMSLTGQQQLFVFYLHDHCDCAGIWQPAFKRFETVSGFRINQQDFIAAVNSDGHIRLVVLQSPTRGTLWWLTGFIEDQCRTRFINSVDNYHKGIIKQLENNQVPYKSYGYEYDPLRSLKGHKERGRGECISSDSSSEVLSSGSGIGIKGGTGGGSEGNAVPPRIEDVRAYCAERKNSVNVDAWWAHYESNGWMVGKNRMKSWRGAVRTWEQNHFKPKGSEINERLPNLN